MKAAPRADKGWRIGETSLGTETPQFTMLQEHTREKTEVDRLKLLEKFSILNLTVNRQSKPYNQMMSTRR